MKKTGICKQCASEITDHFPIIVDSKNAWGCMSCWKLQGYPKHVRKVGA